MRVTSVERETRSYYLTCGDNPKGRGILAIISLGSPQRGDAEVTVCDLEICKNMKAAKKWYRRQMKTKPWEKISQTIVVPTELGKITGLRAEGGKLLAETESGVPMVVPLVSR
jgi:hypothetical protein